MSFLKKPTPAQIDRFTTTDHLNDMTAINIMSHWEEMLDPNCLFFLPVKRPKADCDESEADIYRFLVEPVPSDLPWLGGIVVALGSASDFKDYLDWAGSRFDLDPDRYSAWIANLKLIHKTMPEVNNQWRSHGNKDLRVELHLIQKDGTITFDDILWDCSTV